MDVTKIRFSPKKMTSMSLFFRKTSLFETTSCATSLKNLVLHEKLGDGNRRRTSILGAVGALRALWAYGAVGAVEDR